MLGYLIDFEAWTFIALFAITMLTVRDVRFFVIEFVSVNLTVIGLFVCLLPYRMVPWIWKNDIDQPAGTRWQFYVWIALRNPVSNLRLVPEVSKIGRPYWRKTWGAKPGGFYAHAGWNASGYPVLSAGRNPNAF